MNSPRQCTCWRVLLPKEDLQEQMNFSAFGTPVCPLPPPTPQAYEPLEVWLRPAPTALPPSLNEVAGELWAAAAAAVRNVEELEATEGQGQGEPCAIYNFHLHNGINRTSECIQWWEGVGGHDRGDVDQE